MKKKPASRSAFFNSRVVISLAVCAIVAIFALLAFALYPGGNARAEGGQQAQSSMPELAPTVNASTGYVEMGGVTRLTGSSPLDMAVPMNPSQYSTQTIPQSSSDAAPDTVTISVTPLDASPLDPTQASPTPTPPPGSVVLLDTFTNATAFNITGSVPRTYMGDAFTNTALPGGATSFVVKSYTFYMASVTATAYTDIVQRLQLWNTWVAGNSPVFAGPLTLQTVDLGPLTTTANSFYTVNVTLGTPVTLTGGNGTNWGYAQNFQGNTGGGLVDTDNLTSLITSCAACNGAYAFGQIVAGTAPNYAYYRNVEAQTTFNYIPGDLRTLNLVSQAIGIIIRGDPLGGASPTPTASLSPGTTPSPTATATATTPPPTPTPTPTVTPPPTVCTLTEQFFDINTLIPGGWSVINNSIPLGSTSWFQGTSSVFPAQAGAPDSYVGVNFNSVQGNNTISNWLLTPPVTLENGAVLKFWTRTVDQPQFPDRLQVRMSTNGNSQFTGLGPTGTGDFSTLLLDINPTYQPVPPPAGTPTPTPFPTPTPGVGYPNVWTQFTVTISGVPSPLKGRLAFRYFVENGGPSGTNSDYIGIDTVQYACSPPLVTPTPQTTPTPTPSASPTPCVNYVATTASGSIVAGTTDINNHCDDCSTVITLPFSYRLYDQTFTSVAAGSNGHLTFGTASDAFGVSCIPVATATYAIGPFWADQCTNNDTVTCSTLTGLGIFTSVSGTAPNRIFNIEWRTTYYAGTLPLNYEVRLYEGLTDFDVIYGTVNTITGNDSALSDGVQKDGTQFTLVGCDATGGTAPPVTAGQKYHYTLGVGCPSPTPIAPPTPTPTPTPTPCLTVITQSTSQTPTPGSAACQNLWGHTDNSYWRAFNMSQYANGGEYKVTSVSFAVEQATANATPGAGTPTPTIQPGTPTPTPASTPFTQSVTARLWQQTSGTFPGGTRVQLAAQEVFIPNQSGTMVTVPLVANVPAGTSQLVMEVFTPNGVAATNHFFIGSNAALQLADSYISAADCSIPSPVTTTSIGFPNMHIILDVNGACATPTPSAVPISGTVIYCSNPSLPPIPGVTMTLSGFASGTTTTDGAGFYQFTGLPGNNYTVTPSKAALVPGGPGSSNISTVDVIAIQKHFLGVTLLTGCRLTAGDTAPPTGISTVDVLAAQKFFLQLAGFANTGKYVFNPASRSYSPLTGTMTGQNYDTVVLGDVIGGFVHRPDGGGGQEQGSQELTSTVAAVSLPDVTADQSKSNFTDAVRTSNIDAKSNLIGFQGDFTFDERVVNFEFQPVQAAGLTSNNWNVSGNVLPGKGPMRTLRVSAFSNDLTPLSGSGTLFELKMTRVNQGASRLVWAPAPDQFIFIDRDLNTQSAGNAAPGSITTR